MADALPSKRTWQEVARELERETKPARVVELAKQLIEALDEEQVVANPGSDTGKWKSLPA